MKNVIVACRPFFRRYYLVDSVCNASNAPTSILRDSYPVMIRCRQTYSIKAAVLWRRCEAVLLTAAEQLFTDDLVSQLFTINAG